MNTESVNLGPPASWSELGSWEPVVTTFSSTDWQPYFMHFLFKDILFAIYCGFLNSEFTAESAGTHGRAKPRPHVDVRLLG